MVGKALVHTKRKISAPSYLNIANSGFQLQICSSWEHHRAPGLAEVGEGHCNHSAAVREGSEVTDIQNLRIFPLKHIAQSGRVNFLRETLLKCKVCVLIFKSFRAITR